jgi:hypothetical protein
MSDTRSLHATTAPTGPTEGDGVSYKGLAWFGIILAGTTVVCQILVWGMFGLLEGQAKRDDSPRAPLAAPIGTLAPPPNLLTDEPANLARFRAEEDQLLSTYGWMDKNAGVVRIPIARAKALVLEHGLPVRGSVVEPKKVEKSEGRKVGK